MTVLRVAGLTAGYGQLTVVRDLAMSVGAGEVVTVVGPNGAGKSTTLSAVAGAIAATSGTVELHGRDVSGLGSAARMRHGLAWVPEGRNTFSHLSVRDNLYLSCAMAGLRRQFRQLQEEISAEFPVLSRKLQAQAGSLSGGEQQILALARALVRRPVVTLLDEPTVGLAPSVVDVLGEAVRSRAAQGMAWVVTEQNVSWLHDVTSTVHVMVGGRIVATGDAALLHDRQALRDLFFGTTSGSAEQRSEPSPERTLEPSPGPSKPS